MHYYRSPSVPTDGLGSFGRKVTTELETTGDFIGCTTILEFRVIWYARLKSKKLLSTDLPTYVSLPRLLKLVYYLHSELASVCKIKRVYKRMYRVFIQSNIYLS